MSVFVKFKCDGCFDEQEGAVRLTRRFSSITGKSHGFGAYHYTTPQEAAPDGWIAHDPWTGCTYCPSCWGTIATDRQVTLP